MGKWTIPFGEIPGRMLQDIIIRRPAYEVRHFARGKKGAQLKDYQGCVDESPDGACLCEGHKIRIKIYIRDCTTYAHDLVGSG